MIHTPQKYVTVPLLVEAVYIEETAQWMVNHGRCIRTLSEADFNAQYTPFKEELKDYPTSIINP